MTNHDNDNQEPTRVSVDGTSAVRELIEMMKSGGIGELDIKTDDFKIRLRSEAVAMATAAPVMSFPPAYAMPQMQGMMHGAPAVEAAVTASTPAEKAELEGHVVTSPMIGTYYSASAPGEPAYVQVGDEVETGQIVGIIEAMKIMNEITADQSGVVVEIMVENAQAVEYGSPLIRISSSVALD